MRVCMVTLAYPKRAGDGDGAFVHELAKALTRKGLSVCVIAMHSPGAHRRETIDGIHVIRPRYLRPERLEGLRAAGAGGLPIAWRKYPLRRWQIVPLVLAHAVAICREARDCDLIHAHWTMSGVLAAFTQFVHRKPVVVTLHGTDVFQSGHYPFGKFLLNSVLSKANLVTAVSQALVAAADPRSKVRVQVIPNGVDVDRFTPSAESERMDTILYVGSLILRKGIDILLEAISLASELERFRLLIVGEGPEMARLRLTASELALDDRVQFLGVQPHDQVRVLMQRARVLVLPSLEEGMGVVLLEALACGTPVVGTTVGGIPDVITAEVGALVQPRNAKELAAAIGYVVADPNRWRAMSVAARSRAASVFSWDRVAGSIVDAYSRAIVGYQR